MNTAKFMVKGMHCAGCAQIIQSLLERKTGVHTAKVSFSDAEARILYDNQSVEESPLIKVIEKAGYRASRAS